MIELEGSEERGVGAGLRGVLDCRIFGVRQGFQCLMMM